MVALLAGGYFYMQRSSLAADPVRASTPARQVLPQYVVTIPPLGAIMRELCRGQASVEVLLQPGASPHTYEPKPSDLKKVIQATGFFYVDEQLDGWATGLGAKHRIKLLDMVPDDCQLKLAQSCCPKEHAQPGHVHVEIVDPHFWLDPCVVRACLPGILASLCELDPDGRAVYEENGARFAQKLDEMDRELHAMIDPLRGSKVATAHQSFQYLCHQYGLEVAMVVTDSPGKEPSPRRIEELARQAREQGIKAIYSEPQIPRGAANMLSEASGVPLYELDPVGGCRGRCGYRELILYNAQVLVDSLS
jgi:zinc transport system substrate-binding protein